jgi:hypothetical protein
MTFASEHHLHGLQLASPLVEHRIVGEHPGRNLGAGQVFPIVPLAFDELR